MVLFTLSADKFQAELNHNLAAKDAHGSRRRHSHPIVCRVSVITVIAILSRISLINQISGIIEPLVIVVPIFGQVVVPACLFRFPWVFHPTFVQFSPSAEEAPWSSVYTVSELQDLRFLIVVFYSVSTLSAV